MKGLRPGVEIGIAAGLHNSLRISYFYSKQSGTTTAPNDLVIFSQDYLKGDQLTTNGKLSDYKLSYEYLTWPYPVGGRHFRLKTLWQVQYVTMKTVFDAPIKSSTPGQHRSLHVVLHDRIEILHHARVRTRRARVRHSQFPPGGQPLRLLAASSLQPAG